MPGFYLFPTKLLRLRAWARVLPSGRAVGHLEVLMEFRQLSVIGKWSGTLVAYLAAKIR
jgi:hypothetical protein